MKIDTTRSISLDFVRIFAAFWVLCIHWFACPDCFSALKQAPTLDWVPSILHSFSEWGFLGVDIFFILSGSLIAKSALENEWSNFAKQRFVRLFPAYFLVGLLSLVIYPFATNNVITADKIFSLSGLQFWIGGPPILVVGWTLGIEIAFYLLITFAVYLYSRKNSFGPKEIRNFLNIWLILYILSIAINFEPLQKLLIPNYAPYFILGAVLSLVKSKKDFLSSLFTISISMVLTLKFVFSRVVHFPQLHHKFIASVLLVISMTVLIIFSNRPATSSSTKILNKFIPTLSRMTYPIYLIHFEVGLSLVYFCIRFGLSSKDAFLVALSIIVVISFVVVQYFEPFCKKIFYKYVHKRD